MNKEKDALLEIIANGFASSEFHRFLGLDRNSFDVENSCIRFDMRKEFMGNPKFSILHGGIISAVLDAVGGFAVAVDVVEAGIVEVAQEWKGGTVDLRIDYLIPGRGEHFVASAVILRRGSKVAVVRSELRNEKNDLIAVGTGTYLFG